MSGAKIINALKEAIAGDLARVWIDGVCWEPRRGWQPMDTAPMNGEPVDLWVSSEDGDSVSFYTNGLCKFDRKSRRYEGRVTSMRWEVRGPNRGWYTVGGISGMMAMTIDPSHWMPCPEPPEDRL